MIDLDAVFTALTDAFRQRFADVETAVTDQPATRHQRATGGGGYVITHERGLAVIVRAPHWRMAIDSAGVVWWPVKPLAITLDEADALALALAALAPRR